MSLIIRHVSDEYEILKSSESPSSSCNEVKNFSQGMARQFISSSNISFDTWRSLLMQLGVSIPANFHHANDIFDEAAALCERGKLRIYKISLLDNFKAIPCGKDMGICFIKGPKPPKDTIYKLLIISTRQDAIDVVKSLTASDIEIGKCLVINGLKSQFVTASEVKNFLIESLITKAVLAYKVPIYSNAPPKKHIEFISAIGPGYDKVPLAPESKPTASQRISVNRNEPQSIDDCEKRLFEARLRLDKEGYKSKYSDKEQLEKVKANSVASDRFLVSFQTKGNPDAKLAFQRESGLVPIWATSFDQLENADSDPELIANVLGTTYDPKKEYVLHIVDRGEDLTGFGQNTIVPTWSNIQKPVQQYLGGKHDPEILAEVMTLEYQKKYAKDIDAYHSAGLKEFDEEDQLEYSSDLDECDKDKFSARHNIRTEIGANSEFTGNGLTQSREGGSQYGVVETLTLENNPLPISLMKNVKTVTLKTRGLI